MQPPSSARKEVIFIIGASGNTGQSTLKYLESLGMMEKFHIKGGYRDQSKLQNLSKQFPKVEWVHLNLDDPNSVSTCLQNVDRIYFIPGNVFDRFLHAKTVIDAAILNKVKYFLLMSMIGADELSPALFGRQMGSMEKYLQHSPLNYSILRTFFFQQNLLAFLDYIRNSETFPWPLGRGQIPLLNVDDIGLASARLLTADPISKFSGRSYMLTGPQLLHGEDIAQILSQALGKTIQYKPDPNITQHLFAKAGMQPWQLRGVGELFNLFAADQFAFISQQNRWLLGEDPTYLLHWIQSVVGVAPILHKAAPTPISVVQEKVQPIATHITYGLPTSR